MLPDPAPDKVIMEQQGCFAGCRRAFEGKSGHSDEDVSPGQFAEQAVCPFSTPEGIKLASSLRQAGGGCHIIVGTEGNDQHIRLMGAMVRGDPPADRIDGGDGFLAEPHAGHADAAVGVPDRSGGPVPEHHVELGITEKEMAVLIDQGQCEPVTHPFRQRGCQFKPSESGPQDHYPQFFATHLRPYKGYTNCFIPVSAAFVKDYPSKRLMRGRCSRVASLPRSMMCGMRWMSNMEML